MTRGRGGAIRATLLVVLAVGLGATWHWRQAFDPAALPSLIAGSPATPLAFLALHIVASLFFVPRTMLALAAGLVFGLWWGMLWAALGSVAGAVAGFLVARYIHAGLVAHADQRRLAALLRRVEAGGWRVVALVRLVPIIPHSLTNYALGLTRLGLGAYAVGSLLGQLPLTVAYADLGAAGGRVLMDGGNWRQSLLWPSIIGFGALGLSLLIPLLVRRRLRPVRPL